MIRMVNKIKLLRRDVMKWERQKNIDNNKALVDIEEEIKLDDSMVIDSNFSEVNLFRYHSLLTKKNRYFCIRKKLSIRRV